MRLYHYTSLDCFLKIWRTKRLLFATSHKRTINDIFEKSKTVSVISEEGMDFIETVTNLSLYFQTLSEYRQISLTKDYKDCRGCLSPMMWGQYADNGYGVCIELDSEKLNLPKDIVWQGSVNYTDYIPQFEIKDEIINDSTLYDDYIRCNRDSIFFMKHKHWFFENEYRLISRKWKCLDISKAISKVYIPINSWHTSYVVKRIVANDSLVNYIETDNIEEGHRQLRISPYYETLKK